MFYRKQIVEQLVQLTRKRLYGWFPGTPILDPLTGVSWIGGAGVQLNVIASHEQHTSDKLLKIITNKHTVTRTAVEKSYDISPYLISFHRIIQSVTRDDISAGGLQMKMQQKIEEMNKLGLLNFATIKASTVIEFLKSHSTIVGKVFLVGSITTKFTMNRMLDNLSLTYSNTEKCGSTCNDSKQVSIHKNTITNKFNELYEDFSSKGYLLDQFMHRASIRADTNSAG